MLTRRPSNIKVLFIVLVACVLFIPSSSTAIIEPIRDGDYIYIDNSKAYLKGTYSATHGQNIEHWAMTKQFTGDCDMAIGFNSEVAWPTKVLLDDPHYEYYNTDDSKTFYYVTNFMVTTDKQDYGNWYNPLKYIFDHKVFIGYDNATNEAIWQDVIGTVVFFDSQENDGVNYTAMWHTEHSRFEQYRDISHRILVNPIEYEFDDKNLWYITKNIPMTANEMRKIIIEMDGKVALGEQSYKYDIIWKPSHQTIAEAKISGNLYVLDPYWNSSWNGYSTVIMNTTAPKNEFQVLFSSDDYTIPLDMWNVMNQDGNDTRILNYNHTIVFPHWIEHFTARDDYRIWVNVTNNDSLEYQWYYDNPPASSTSNGNTTFIQYHGAASASFLDTPQSSINEIIYEGIVRTGTDTSNVGFGIGDVLQDNPPDSLGAKIGIITEDRTYFLTLNDGTSNSQRTDGVYHEGIYYRLRIERHGSSAEMYIDDVQFMSSSTTYLPDENMGLFMYITTSTGDQKFSFIRKYNTTEPIITDIGSPNYYVNSLHYNATIPYNHTIESDGTMTANRSITIPDDINDTALSTGTSYLQITQFNNLANIVRNFTISGDNLDWYQAANLTGQYALKNSSGIIETKSNGNFTIDLSAGDYWIESIGGPIITLLSQYPSDLFGNSTGDFNLTYGIEHVDVDLNGTTLAFKYTIYDNESGTFCHSIRPSDNNLCDFIGTYKIARGDNRNKTGDERLNWEGNVTITEGSVCKWSGMDENSTRVNVVAVNSTYTMVYINGSVQGLATSDMHYLCRKHMQNASKTQYEINKNNDFVAKIYNSETMKGNDENYTITVWVGTNIPGTTPTSNLDIFWANDSWNPEGTVEVEDSPYATYATSFTATEWINWSFQPSAYSNYISLNIGGNIDPSIIHTNESYLIFKSSGNPNHGFGIDVTNAATCTNKSFAETGVVWEGNSPAYSQYLYTPDLFMSFHRGNQVFQSMMHIADTNGTWGNSTLHESEIKTSIFPPTATRATQFEFEGFNDTSRDATYRGTFGIWIDTSHDPDGGNVSHNLTLCYDNGTHVALINNSFNNSLGNSVNITFNSTPYYSTTEMYTLKCVLTDDENVIRTVICDRNFSLSPLGTTGVIKDNGRVTFWGVDNVSQLYTLISDDDYLSLSGGIYYANKSLHMSQYQDTFLFDEHVRMKSVNDTGVYYYRWTGDCNISDAKITSWNATAGAPAPTTDTYRTFVCSDEYYSRTNITDSNLSYLGRGIDPYYGVYIHNCEGMTINNSTFLYNQRALNVQNGGNFTISNCNISHMIGHSIYCKSDYGNVLMHDNHMNSTSTSKHTGITLDGIGSGNNISNNYFTVSVPGRVQYPYYIRDSTDTIFRNNTCVQTQYGIAFGYGVDNITLESNNLSVHIDDETGHLGYGISVFAGTHNISNNTIVGYNSYGIRIWGAVDCHNNTLTNNSITINDTGVRPHALTDYIFYDTSLGNVIRNPADATNTISMVNTSSVIIENTDGQAFSEDSDNTTAYAYTNGNFSLELSGTTEIMNITQHNMTILPSTDRLAVWNLEWGTSVKFNASSDTALNPTWFNLTKISWASELVYIYRNDSLFANETSDASGLITYNYSDNYSEKYFEFKEKVITPISAPEVYVPLSIFIMWSVIMFAGVIIGFMTTGLYGITSSLLTATIAYMNSKNIINGNVVQYFAGESTTDTIEIGYRSIESLPLSYIFLFIAIVMVVIFILHTVHEIQYHLEPDIGGEMNE